MWKGKGGGEKKKKRNRNLPSYQNGAVRKLHLSSSHSLTSKVPVNRGPSESRLHSVDTW